MKKELMDLTELMEQNPLLPGIALRLPQLEIIEQLLRAALNGTGQRWYTLEQAHTRKHGAIPGGVSLSTVRNCLALQPRGGIPDGWASGRKVWRADTIEEWCKMDDTTLPEYLAAYAPHLRVPSRIIEANKRHVLEYQAANIEENV